MVENGIEYSGSWAENRRSFGDNFFWVKLANTCFPFTYPQALQSIHNPTSSNHPQAQRTSPQPTLTPHLSPCYYLYTLHHNNSITVKGSNNTIDKTLYINNIVIPQHTKNPLELKIEPCRTMLYFKASNRLFKSRLYLINTIIKQYN